MAHQKVLVTLIICIGIIGSVFVISKTGNSQTKTEKNDTPKENIDLLATIDKTSDVDTDGDGLKDWEESLIGTNPQLKDTDIDGTSDGDEVTQNRDPKKKGPNDKNVAQNIGTSAGSLNTSGTTLTEQVSKEFFSRYIAAKQQNINVSQEEAALIAQSVIQNTYITPTIKLYTKKDITLNTDTSESSKKAYAQALSTAINKNSPKNIQNELVIFTQTLQNQKESDLLKLDIIIKGYRGIITDTLKIRVPSDTLANHLIYLNSLSAIMDDISYMRLIISDPIKAYAGFSNYQRDALKLKIVLENLEKYFAQ